MTIQPISGLAAASYRGRHERGAPPTPGKGTNNLNHGPPEDDKDSLISRFDIYFLNHYIGLHSTIVSVAIAVAGLAAASLLGTSRIYQSYYALLWLLWLASILCCAAVYVGVLSSVIVIPAGIPSAFDVLIPLFIGVSEFLLFGVLAHQATGLTRTSSVIHAWFLSFIGFCLCSVTGILRADRISARGPLATDIKNAKKLHSLLRRDAFGVCLIGACGVLGAIVVNGRTFALGYLLAIAILAGLSRGLLGHRETARTVENVIRSQTNPSFASHRYVDKDS